MNTASENRWDVLIAGAGPAGMAAAASCASAGLSTLVLDPTLEAGWSNNYGGWADELGAFAHLATHQWTDPLVYSDESGRRSLARTYIQLDNQRLREHLRSQATSNGARFEAVGVSGVGLDERGATVSASDGRRLHAQIVVDATGSGRFLKRADVGSSRAWQTAYGIFATVSEHPWADNEMVLMDFRALPDPLEKPTFLYAMPTDDRQIFLEETSLASAPEVPVDVLQRRLKVRLAQLGIEVLRVDDVERCRFPMNTPQPEIPQPIVGFGAAAGFIHPATGYSVARSLQSAPALARALVGGLSQGGPSRAAALAWEAIQPRALRRSHHLALAGLESLLGLNPSALGEFMSAFFAMPERHWSAYLSGTATPGAVAGAMLQLSRHLPAPVLSEVLRGALRGRDDLLNGLLPDWAYRAS